MRIVAIGLGGAGCRIVDRLYATDRHSSRVACVQALAVDVDEQTLTQLKGLPENAKISFSALDVGLRDKYGSDEQTATIDIGEIISKVQNFESGETDAIFICCGLGGNMSDVAPHVVAALRSSVVEPIFGLVTLPCLAEGAKKSSKAADDIDTLEPILDGIILFDNETWYKKIKAEKAHLLKREKGFVEKIGLKKEEQPISPVMATYTLLNEGIVRRVSLILRAGEFRADGGIDLAEVVLDSGEVINTMKGMGFITIGYAVERIPNEPLGFLSRFKPAGVFNEEQKKKASRIVELAKQAIYHEVSIPCDMTSAHKALVLVAGPSHEISMKGFMTVRKWIDRSITGLETRSGDYPVMNTQNVAIIIMLAGLENIPRITELKEIQGQYKSRQQKGREGITERFSKVRDQVIESRTGDETINFSTPILRDSNRDEMIVLPAKQPSGMAEILIHKARDMDPAEQPITESYDIEEAPVMDATPVKTIKIVEKSVRSYPVQHIDRTIPETKSPHLTHQRVSHNNYNESLEDSSKSPSYQPIRSGSKVKVSDSSSEPDRKGNEEFPVKRSPTVPVRTNETERQRIERELQRQRMLVISGNRQKSSTGTTKTHTVITSTPISNPKILTNPAITDEGEQTVQETSQVNHERKTIIVARKKNPPIQKNTISVDESEEKIQHPIPDNENFLQEPICLNKKAIETINIGLREPVRKAKDEIFTGKEVGRGSVNQVRDSGIIRTHLKIKPGSGDSDRNNSAAPRIQPAGTTEPSKKQDKKISEKNDLLSD